MNPKAESPAEVKKDETDLEKPVTKTVEYHRVALILPFQLDKVNVKAPNSTDVKRAAMALDFYQGFELGLKYWTKSGYDFSVTVLDSRDSEARSASLASSEELNDTEIIVGPVYPKEINSFGQRYLTRATKNNVLQISPLAASMPSEFSLPNLVSITPPIVAHIEGLANRIVAKIGSSEAIYLYHTSDASSKQFLPLLKAEILKRKRGQTIYDIENQEQLIAHLRPDQNNVLVCGTDNQFQVIRILEEVSQVSVENGAKIKLYGHPTWAKLNLRDQSHLSAWDAEITTSYYVDNQNSKVVAFRNQYQELFQVSPSEFSFKGFDIGLYIGELLSKYGSAHASKIIESSFEGLHNSFEFEFNPRTGYVNMGVQFLEFKAGSFVKIK